MRDLAIARPMLVSGDKPVSGREPVRVRDGPAAVRGDASAPTRHWPRAGKAARREPRVRRPPPAGKPNPSRKGGFVSIRTRRTPRRSSALSPAVPAAPAAIAHTGSSRCRRPRLRSLFAIGAGKQVVAVDDQSDYPSGHLIRRSQASRRTSRRSPTYRPDLVVVQYDSGGVVRGAREAEHPGARPAECQEPRRRVQADHAARDR